MGSASPEKAREVLTAPEKPSLTVQQPQKLENLLSTIELIESFSERVGERPPEQGGAAGPGVQAGGAQPQASWRDQAIANLPEPPAMQTEIRNHIKQEIRQLQREVRRVSRGMKPGAAYKLTKLYARIRRLNRLLAEILEASYEVLRRLFIRVVIDRQSIT
jgi:hypothetical protein